MDVLEIDGASNRGIDEMRALRQNVGIRPSRSRFKIYIIDEVHMLTEPAFNALLKTLEEPPEHVKFIFCTTEPEKIPVTVLSRCQRFDFAGVQTRSIAIRLAQIAQAEGAEVEPDALAVLARRAAGSMRDSQSLLEQLLAFAGPKVTVLDVQRMLGTAGDQRLGRLVDCLVQHDAGAALSELDRALAEGVDVGPLLEQLLGYFRDLLVAAVGGSADALLYVPPAEQEVALSVGRQLGIASILAALNILEQAIVRLRLTTHARIVAELALVRICALAELDDLPALIAQLHAGGELPVAGKRTAAGGAAKAVAARRIAPTERFSAEPTAKLSAEPTAKFSAEPTGQTSADPMTSPAADRGSIESTVSVSTSPGEASSGEKKNAPATAIATPSGSPEFRESASDPELLPALEITSVNAAEIWQRVLVGFTDLLGENASRYSRIAISAPNRLAVFFSAEYTICKSFCERPDQAARLERALYQVVGKEVKVSFCVDEGTWAPVDPPAMRRRVPLQERLKDKAEHPLVRRAGELLSARPVRLEEPDG